MVREGDRINNYLLEAKVGAGSFGEVWRARHHVFGTHVAVKVPTDPQYVRNLQREGVAVHGLHHPNIVRAIDLDPYADPPYYIMEYVEGPSLREVIDRYGITFPIPAAVNVLRGILEALAAAHQAGLIHRDLKPPNVLLNHPLETIAELLPSAVKVTDFGLGKIGGSTTQSIMQSGSLLTEEGRSISGTLAYMSPEQREGGELDARSDLYSCGVVLFEMLTGERPQGGEAPSSLRVDAPRFLDEVFERCYARRERRYGSAQEVLSALTRGRGAGGMRPRASTRDGAPTCPRCGGSVHRQDHYCVHCGEQLVAAVPRCRSCRAYVHGGDRFCIFCGQDLRVMVG